MNFRLPPPSSDSSASQRLIRRACRTSKMTQLATTASLLALCACGGGGTSSGSLGGDAGSTSVIVPSATQGREGVAKSSPLAAPIAPTEVVVKAKGSLSAGVGPVMELRINGLAVGRIEVRSNTMSRYVFKVTTAIAPGAKIDVVFTNDAVINGQDRNLWVESLELLGQTLRPTDPGVTYDRGPLDGQNVIPGQTAMLWSGALRFTAPGQQSSAVVIQARADLAGGVGAMMVLRVNSQAVGGAMVNSTQWTPYTFNVGKISAGALVEVAFTNDAMVYGVDRNLYVQELAIDGAKLMPNASGVKYVLLDGRELPGTPVMPWNGALRFSTPSMAPTPTPTPPSPPPPPTPSGTGVANPATIGGKPLSGPIVAHTGQVIENLHIQTNSGPCIVVPPGVSGVVIRNNEIGPCGAGEDGIGVRIDDRATNITVQRNVIHDVSSGVYAQGANHPIIMDRNFVYNVHGPMPRGQMVQFNGVSGGSGQSKVTCNVSDKEYGNGRKAYEDHINMFRTEGLPGLPIEIARNRIRGGSSISGSGMMMGDYGGGNIWVHDNVLTLTANTGIGIAGGHNIVIENNRIFNDGQTASTLTGLSMSMHNFSPEATSCSGHRIVGNRGISRTWVYGGQGERNPGFFNSGLCTGNVIQDNNFSDASLSAAEFDAEIPGCQ